MLLSARPLFADQLGLGVIFWSAATGSGFYETDLEDRFFKDDLVNGSATSASAARYNMKASNHDQFAVPFQVYYSSSALPQLRVEAEYFSLGADIQYHSFSDLPNVTRIHLNELHQFKRRSYSGGVSYGFLGFMNKNPISALRVKLGYARETTDFSLTSVVFSTSQAIVVSPTDNRWESAAKGPYVGAELVIPVSGRWALAGSYVRSASLRGDMRNENFQILPESGGGFGAQWDRTSARYRVQRDLQTAEVRHYVTSDFIVSFGFRRMVYKTRYPGYFSYSVNQQAGTISVLPLVEVLTDAFMFYGEERVERIGNTFFSFRKIFKF